MLPFVENIFVARACGYRALFQFGRMRWPRNDALSTSTMWRREKHVAPMRGEQTNRVLALDTRRESTHASVAVGIVNQVT